MNSRLRRSRSRRQRALPRGSFIRAAAGGVLVPIYCALFALLLSGYSAAAQTSTDTPAAGKKLYATSCAFCHGPEGDDSAVAPSLRKSKLDAIAVTAIVSDGKPGTAMLPFKGTYNAAQIADLTAFVLSLSSGSPSQVSANPPAVVAESGAAIYASRCAVCHESGGPPYLNHFVLKAAAPE